jgi:hypothetical protein
LRSRECVAQSIFFGLITFEHQPIRHVLNRPTPIYRRHRKQEIRAAPVGTVTTMRMRCALKAVGVVRPSRLRRGAGRCPEESETAGLLSFEELAAGIPFLMVAVMERSIRILQRDGGDDVASFDLHDRYRWELGPVL